SLSRYDLEQPVGGDLRECSRRQLWVGCLNGYCIHRHEPDERQPLGRNHLEQSVGIRPLELEQRQLWAQWFDDHSDGYCRDESDERQLLGWHDLQQPVSVRAVEQQQPVVRVEWVDDHRIGLGDAIRNLRGHSVCVYGYPAVLELEWGQLRDVWIESDHGIHVSPLRRYVGQCCSGWTDLAACDLSDHGGSWIPAGLPDGRS